MFMFWSRSNYEVIARYSVTLGKIDMRVAFCLDAILVLSHKIQVHMSWFWVTKYKVTWVEKKLNKNVSFTLMQMELDSVKLNLRLTAANLQKVFKTCQDFLRSHYLTLVELSKVIALFHPPYRQCSLQKLF